MMHAVHYVPEQKTVESLLQFFRKRRTDSAVVVDEYGGVAGSVCIEDVAEALFGPLQYQDARDSIEQVGPFQYRLPGSLPIHDWMKAFGVHPAHADIATVGGWITALLGRIPKADDTAHWNNLTFKVEHMHRHRVKTVILTIGIYGT
jgi:magnesium and cobalt transporter